jgi:prevent-host-death family protein
MTALSFSQVRAQFAHTLQYVRQQQQPVIISQHGKPTAVLMSIEQFEQLQPSATDFMQRLRVWRAAEGIDQSCDDCSDVFDDLRAKEQERDLE